MLRFLAARWENSNNGCQQKVIWISHACLRVVVRQPFMQKAGNDAFIAHYLFVVNKSESSFLNASGNERREAHESLFFVVFSFESQSFNRAEVNFNLGVFGFQFNARSR